MPTEDKAARLQEIRENAQRQIREIAENPDMAACTVGKIVVELMRVGAELSYRAIVVRLEGIADGRETASLVTPEMAQGALKVIFDPEPE